MPKDPLLLGGAFLSRAWYAVVEMAARKPVYTVKRYDFMIRLENQEGEVAAA